MILPRSIEREIQLRAEHDVNEFMTEVGKHFHCTANACLVQWPEIYPLMFENSLNTQVLRYASDTAVFKQKTAYIHHFMRYLDRVQRSCNAHRKLLEEVVQFQVSRVIHAELSFKLIAQELIEEVLSFL